MTLARPTPYPYPSPEPYASSPSSKHSSSPRSRSNSVSIYPSPPLWLGQIPPRLRSNSQRNPTPSTSKSVSLSLSLSVSPPTHIRKDANLFDHRLSDTELSTSPQPSNLSSPSSPAKYNSDTTEPSEMRSTVGAMPIGLGPSSGGVVKRKKLARHRMMYLLGESVDEYGNIITDSTRFEKQKRDVPASATEVVSASARRVSSKEREREKTSGMGNEESKRGRSRSREKDVLGENVRVYTVAIPDSPAAGNGLELPLEEDGERTPRPTSRKRLEEATWSRKHGGEQVAPTIPLITPPYSDGDEETPCPASYPTTTPTSISSERETYLPALTSDCSVVTPPSSFDSNYDDSSSFDSSSDEDDIPSHLRWSIRRLSGIKSNVSLLQRQRQSSTAKRSYFPQRDIEQSSRLWEESRKVRVDVQLREREVDVREERKEVRFKMFVLEDDREEWTNHRMRDEGVLRDLLEDAEEVEAGSTGISRRTVQRNGTAVEALPLSDWPLREAIPTPLPSPSKAATLAPLSRKLPLDPNVWIGKRLDAYIPYLAYKDTPAFAAFIGKGTQSSSEVEGDLSSSRDLSSVQFTRFNIPPEEYISDDPLPPATGTEEIEEQDYFIPKPPPRKRSDCDLLRKRVLEWNMVRCGKANGVRTRGEKEPRIHAFCDVTCRAKVQEINIFDVTVSTESGRFVRGLRRVRSAKWSDLGATMDKAMKASFGVNNEVVMDRWKDRMDRGYEFGYGMV